MKLRKAIFALTSDKSKAIFIEEITAITAPTPDTFPYYFGIELVVATTNEDSVYWVIDSNPYVEIVPTQDDNIFSIMRSEHAAHIPGDIHVLFKQLSVEMGTKVKAPLSLCNNPNCTLCRST